MTNSYYRLTATGLIMLLIIGCEGETSRYIQSFADPANGCEYFTSMDGGMYPRLNRDGSHFGCK
jgi:hypothetical protein